MVKSIGVDIVETARITRLVEAQPERFPARILGPQEMAIYEGRMDKIVFLAGRFAAKEAIIKALGCYLTDKPPLASLQVLPDEANMPAVSLPDDLVEQLAGVTIMISISHEKNYAVAVAICAENK